MNTTRPTLIIMLATLLFVAAVSADVPHLISYQGRLMDSDGSSVADGDYNLTFQIFEHNPPLLGETALWSSGVQSVTVTDGLFTYYLGSHVPLPPSVFTDTAVESHYVRVLVQGVMLAGQGVRMVTAPFAFKAVSADTAAYAYAGPGGSSASGWVDDGSVVRLESGADRVGIGTASPSEPLVVGGDLGSFPEANYVVSCNPDFEGFSGYKLGFNADNHATLQWYGDGDQLRFHIRAMGTTYNNNLILRAGNVGIGVDYPTENLVVGRDLGSFNGNRIVVGGSAPTDYAGLIMGEDGDNRAFLTWSIDGNYFDIGIEDEGTQWSQMIKLQSGEVSVGVGSGNSSVKLPNNSVSSQEILDEAGVNVHYNESPVTVYHGQPIASATTYFPGPGYALVVATANWYPKATEHTVDVNLSISERTDVLGDPAYRYNFTAGSHTHNLSSTIHDVIEIDSAGAKTLYLMMAYWETAENTTTTATGQISVLYVPTSYGSIVLPPPGGAEATISGEDEAIPQRPDFEQLVAERVQAETSVLRADFERRLQALREEFQKRLEGLSQ
jgi:hypothetical protein